jgi:hypothetical protein
MNVKRAVNPSRVDEFVINDDVIVSISYRRGKSFGFQIKCKPDVTGIKIQLNSQSAVFAEEVMIGLFDYAADNLVAAINGFTSVSTAE